MSLNRQTTRRRSDTATLRPESSFYFGPDRTHIAILSLPSTPPFCFWSIQRPAITLPSPLSWPFSLQLSPLWLLLMPPLSIVVPPFETAVTAKSRGAFQLLATDERRQHKTKQEQLWHDKQRTKGDRRVLVQ